MKKEKKIIWNILSISLIFILLSPLGMSAEQNYNYEFHLVKKLPVSVEGMAFNLHSKLVYAYSSRNLYVIDALTEEIKKKVVVLDSSYNSPIYSLNGIGFNPNTNKIYLSAATNEVWVMNASDYKITKKIKISSTENPNYRASSITVDEKTNMIYVESKLPPPPDSYMPVCRYTVINGNNDTMVKIIPYGALDFYHNALCIWEVVNITVEDLNSEKIIKIIKTNISENDFLLWDNPHIYFSANRLFILSEMRGIMEYDMKNYRIMRYWNLKQLGLKEGDGLGIGAYDSDNHILYATYQYPINSTSFATGIMAVNTDNGNILAKMSDITWSDLYGHGGSAWIVDVNPVTHNLYACIKEQQSTSAELVIYSLQRNSTPMDYVTISAIIIAGGGVLIAGLWIYHRKKQNAMK